MIRKRVFSVSLLLIVAVFITSCGGSGSGSNSGDSENSSAITAFGFTSAKNSVLSTDVTGVISGTNIAVTVPYGTTVTALVATFTTTGTSVKIGTTEQTSGTTVNDFSSAKTYTVTAADGSAKDYTVTVTVAADLTKAIIAFGFAAANNPSLPADVLGTITGTSIHVTVPYGTSVGGLVASVKMSHGCNAYIGSYYQTPARDDNDFTNPVTYTVKSLVDGSTQNFTVTVTVASNSSKEITYFGFPSLTLVDVYDYYNQVGNVYGTAINGTSITVAIPYGSTTMAASFTANGTVTVGGVTQVSGVTLNDFKNPVTYRVTAADGSWQDYTVRVIFGPGISCNGHVDLATYWVAYSSTSTDADSLDLRLHCDAFNAESHTYFALIQMGAGSTYPDRYALADIASSYGATLTCPSNDERYLTIWAPSFSAMKSVLGRIGYIPPANPDEVLLEMYLADYTSGLSAHGKLTITVSAPE